MAPKKLALHVVQGSSEIEEASAVWHDAGRNRDVSVKMYLPIGDHVPVAVFSHGIGEDRESYAWLGRSLARAGFLAVHVTHAGTDRAVLQRGYRYLYRATKQKENWINRPLDVSFVLDQLRTLPRADLSRVAVIGHSAGAFTAFAVAGIHNARGETLRDERVKVAVAMSMPRLVGVIPADGYDSVAIPVLNLTGTCDTSLLYRTFPRHRRIPFDTTHARDQYLVTFAGVNHDTFSNREDRRHAVIAGVTIGFLRAFLLDDQNARRWFDEPGATRLDNTGLTVERKMR